MSRRRKDIEDFKAFARAVRGEVEAKISENAQGGFFARGLAGEGYAGGYRDCLDDVLAVLDNTPPQDLHGYWRMALERIKNG